jgi:hypothetical protein
MMQEEYDNLVLSGSVHRSYSLSGHSPVEPHDVTDAPALKANPGLHCV